MAYDMRCRYSRSLNLALTGATGFVGAAVIKASLTDDFLPIPVCDIPDDSIVLHLAAGVSSDRESLVENIDRDSWLIAEVERRHKGLIYASTNNVYPYAIDCRIEETPKCSDYYSASKIVGEMIIRDLLSKPSCIVRIADVFGYGQRHGNLFRAIEKSIQRKESLNLYGTGMKRRSYIYCPELANFLLYLVGKIEGDEFLPTVVNACYSDASNVKELISKIADVAGLPVNIIGTEVDGSMSDIRTMLPGPYGGYELKWATFQDALVDYVDRCRN